MVRRSRSILLAAAALSAAAAAAQPIDLPLTPSAGDKPPKAVKIVQSAGGPIFALRDGRTLYGLDMRTVLRAGPDPAQYCARAECAAVWQPLLAPGAKPNMVFPRGKIADGSTDPQKAPDWTVIQAAQGPQWVYKGWHLVFARKGDTPGSAAFDGAEGLTWNTLKYVPPVPTVTAPPGVSAVLDGDAYALSAGDGQLLFAGTCAAPCRWAPFAGAAASRGVGQWRIDASGDAPQWTYRDAKVWIAARDDPRAIPAGGKVLRP